MYCYYETLLYWFTQYGNNQTDWQGGFEHRLNMELDLQSLFGLHVHSTAALIGWDPAIPLPPALGLLYEGAIGQPRKTTSLCEIVTPWFEGIILC